MSNNQTKQKLLWIDHSYHKKTSSSKFFSDYLSEFFDVTVFYDESWQKKSSNNLKIDNINQYSHVVLWQTLPDKKILQELKGKNVTFVPMYDAVQNWDYFKWVKVKDFKILCFAKAIYDYLNKFNFDTHYLQYYTPPKDFSEGVKNSAFLWQRVTDINFETMKGLLGDYLEKAHIHRSIDPNHRESEISDFDKDKYNVTLSNWFETREDFERVIRNNEIFIAPRYTEGIGLPVLEAMAMGKAIVANNAPTMNEYIKHGVNGYLADFSNPQSLDFSNIDEIKKNAYNSSVEGYKNWLETRKKIIEFLNKKTELNTKLFKMFLESFADSLFSFKKKNGKIFIKLFFIKIKL